MLEVAVKYQQAFVRMENDGSQFEDYFQEKIGKEKREGPPRNDDWAMAARVVKNLEIFYNATLTFSGSNVMTANAPSIWMNTIVQELNGCINGNDIVLKEVATAMKEKFDKYWRKLEDMNKAMLLAVVLDPRYKMEYLQYFFAAIEKDKKKVKLMEFQIKDLLMLFYYEYEKVDPTTKEAFEAVTRHNSSDNTAEPLGQDSHSANIEKFLQMRQEKKVFEIKNEVDKYMNDVAVNPRIKKFNVLNWWKEHSKGYPVLSKIARDVLVVPASTVALESDFSVGSRVFDPFRASLTPKMVQALVCTSDWLKAGGFSFFKDTSQVEVELYGECENIEKGDPEPVDV